MTDIVVRLRDPYIVFTSMVVRLEAAEEIERLQHEERQLQTTVQLHLAEIERLRHIMATVKMPE
jgi:hypothetical protein